MLHKSFSLLLWIITLFICFLKRQKEITFTFDLIWLNCFPPYKLTVKPLGNLRRGTLYFKSPKTATGGQSNTAVQPRPLVRLEWQAEVCFSSHHRADQRRLALAWPVITLITQENDNNTGSLMTEVIVVEVPRYAAVVWWMISAMHRAVRRLLLHVVI